MTGNRKRVRHFHEPGDCHELTFSCYHGLPLLSDETRLQMLAASINRAIRRHGFRMIAFVFMPEHVHLLVCPTGSTAPISALLQAIKRPFSWRVRQALEESRDQLLQQLMVQERPGRMVFRFWQEGGGYDRNLTSEKAVLSAIDYIHMNPVRRQLCAGPVDWKWSSARWYADPQGRGDPDLPTIEGLPPEFFTETGRE